MGAADYLQKRGLRNIERITGRQPKTGPEKRGGKMGF